MLHLKDSDAPNRAMFMGIHMKIWHASDNKLQMMMHWQGFDTHMIKLARGTCKRCKECAEWVRALNEPLAKANLSEHCEAWVTFNLALMPSAIRPP